MAHDSDLDRRAVDGMARIASAINVLEASIVDGTWADIEVHLDLVHLLDRARRDIGLVVAS
jgi:hypothetical protein